MFKLAKDETILGRSDDADLRLIDDGVSRHHAALLLEGDRVRLKDLGSANGTFCNGARLSDSLHSQRRRQDLDRWLDDPQVYLSR